MDISVKRKGVKDLFVSDDKWIANSPDSIQIETRATSYQLKKGDTLWANVSVEVGAEPTLTTAETDVTGNAVIMNTYNEKIEENNE